MIEEGAGRLHGVFRCGWWDNIKMNRTDMGLRGGGLALSGLGWGPVGGFFLNESEVSVKKKEIS